MISSFGPTNAKIFILGDYPSQGELENNSALYGHTSNSLHSLFSEAGIHLDSCFRSIYLRENIHEVLIKIRNKNKGKRTTGYALLLDSKYDQLRNYVIEELKLIKPKVIVPLGEAALRFITGEKSIHDFRGSTLHLADSLKLSTDLHSTYVVPLVHPREYFADNSQRFIAAFDIAKIVRLSQTPFYDPLQKYKVWVCRSSAELESFFHRHRAAPFWTFDIETHAGFITCISFCGDGVEAISVPLLDNKTPLSERALMYFKVANFLASDKPKVNQNIKFDATFLEAWGYEVNNILDDTMILAHSIYGELRKSLGFLTSVHTDIPYYKDEGKEFDPRKHTKDQLFLYNAKDALATWQVYVSQVKDAKTTGVWDFHVRGPRKWFSIYKKMDSQGFLLDHDRRLELLDRYTNISEYTRDSLADLTNNPKFNPNSSKQCCDLIYGELKCPVQWRKDAAGDNVKTTDEDALEELILNFGAAPTVAEILQLMIKSRKLHRIINFLNNLYDIDDRVRQSTKQTGTENGRTSASKSIFRRNIFHQGGFHPGGSQGGYSFDQANTGYSFQTIPKHGFRLPSGEILGDDLMSIYVPSPGYCFVGGDLSQAEARVVAVLAEDWDLLQGFDTRDIHKETASWIYECSVDDIKKPSFERDLGKMTRHAGNLDMQYRTLALRAHIPQPFALKVMQRFHNNAPKVRGIFHKTIADEVSRSRLLVSPQGRQRFFFGKINEDLFREAYSFIPQATISDQMKNIMLYIHERMDARFIYEAHDGVMAEQKIEEAERFLDLFKEASERTIDFRAGTIRRDINLLVPAELDYSLTNAGEMKPYKGILS